MNHINVDDFSAKATENDHIILIRIDNKMLLDDHDKNNRANAYQKYELAQTLITSNTMEWLIKNKDLVLKIHMNSIGNEAEEKIPRRNK